MNGDHHPVGRPLGERGVTIDRAELRKRAGAASVGDWHIRHDDEVWIGVQDDEVDRYIAGGGFEADSLYIVAAQPQVVLALLDRIEELEGAVAPFAALGKEAAWLEKPDGKQAWGFDGVNLSWGDFRRARKALSGEKP